MKPIPVTHKGYLFTAYQLTKPQAVETFSEWLRYVAVPGDWLVVDKHLNTGVYTPAEFKKAFKVVKSTERSKND